MSWEKQWSHSANSFYFVHTRTREQLWHDPALPQGWAWGQADESPDAPKFFVDLRTGLRLPEPPTTLPTPTSPLPQR